MVKIALDSLHDVEVIVFMIDVTYPLPERLTNAKQVLEKTVSEHPLILEDPEPTIRVHELADSSVNFVCRPWTQTEHYWEVYWDLTRKVKENFDAAGVSIPFPQRDVHLFQDTDS